ncbi:MAG: hypothetical protein QHI48_11865 [Bacteroidota bacterium]|nr:hypothetical protein [Bacteroidota bacterium]
MTGKELQEIEEIIIARMATILDKVYHEPLSDVTREAVDAHLAFKADPHLNELRLALQRISRREYGKCIFCKEEIPFPILRELPTAHFCDRCANILRKRTSSGTAVHPE